MTNYTDDYLASAHLTSFRNEDAVKDSITCGCFYCLSIFPASEVTEFNEGTAECPYCGVDCLIPDDSGFPTDPGFLQAMEWRYFGDVWEEVLSEQDFETIGNA